jgi:methionine sulfoxide reductase heme-binding subunit
VFAAGVFVWLASWRLLPRRMQAQPLLFAALAVSAALATAGIEGLWYALATGVPALRVVAANLRLVPWPRPAVWIAIVFAAVALIGTLRRWPRRLRPAPIAA